MKYSPDPRFDSMSLEELRGVDVDELNIVQRLQVQKRIGILEREEVESAAAVQSWYQKWSFWAAVATLLIALMSIGVSLAVNAASQEDTSFERTEQLVRLCSLPVPDDPEVASQELLELYRNDPVLAEDKFRTTMSNYAYGLACLGYIGGFKDMLYILNSNAKLPQQVVCFPASGVSNGQAAKIFLKWAEDNPEQIHKPPAVGLLLALAEAFPCVQQQTE